MINVYELRTGKFLFRTVSAARAHRIIRFLRNAHPGLSVEIRAA